MLLDKYYLNNTVFTVAEPELFSAVDELTFGEDYTSRLLQYNAI